jgi:hypothetical protein
MAGVEGVEEGVEGRILGLKYFQMEMATKRFWMRFQGLEWFLILAKVR